MTEDWRPPRVDNILLGDCDRIRITLHGDEGELELVGLDPGDAHTTTLTDDGVDVEPLQLADLQPTTVTRTDAYLLKGRYPHAVQIIDQGQR